MKITIEPDHEGEKDETTVHEGVYAFVLVGSCAGPTGTSSLRVSRAHPRHIYDLVELLVGMKYRLLPLAEPTKVS